MAWFPQLQTWLDLNTLMVLMRTYYLRRKCVWMNLKKRRKKENSSQNTIRFVKSYRRSYSSFFLNNLKNKSIQIAAKIKTSIFTVNIEIWKNKHIVFQNKHRGRHLNYLNLFKYTFFYPPSNLQFGKSFSRLI